MAKFDLSGHRGARGLFPENTIQGFLGALKFGVTSLEFDVGLTADLIPVVTHDTRLNSALTRDPNGVFLETSGAPIAQLTYAELARYDVGRLRPGTSYAAQFPDQQPLDGARIPKLSEVFQIPADIIFDAEVKTEPGVSAEPDAIADAIVAAASAAGVLPRLVIRSFDWRALKHLQKKHSEISLVWLTDRKNADPEAVSAAGGKAWAPDFSTLTQPMVEQAKALGLRVLPWTVNQPADFARLRGWGVDGICTDRPDRFTADSKN